MAKKQTLADVTPGTFNPLPSAVMTKLVSDLNRAKGIQANVDCKVPMSTGVLSIDLMLFGGYSGGRWVTSFGPEQSYKSTTCMEMSAWHAAQRFIDLKTEPNSRLPTVHIFDYEGSVEFAESDSIQFMTLVHKWAPDATYSDIFGVRDAKGSFSSTPIVFLYKSIPDLETAFEYIHDLAFQFPDVIRINDSWYYKYPAGTTGFESVADKELSKTTKGVVIPAGDNLPGAQAIFVLDSLPAMTPRAFTGDDPSAALALQARAFSEQIKRIQSLRTSKRLAIWAVNQLRDNPGAQRGKPPQYEPCGNAPKFYSDGRLRHSPIAYSTMELPSHFKQVTGRQQCIEPCWDGFGDDVYSFVKLRSTKMKMGGLDQVEVSMRIWASSNGKIGLGYDPAWDTWQALTMMGLTEKSTGNKYRVNAFGLEKAEIFMTWNEFKTLCLAPEDTEDGQNAIADVYDHLRIPEDVAVANLRNTVYAYIFDGSFGLSDGIARMRDTCTGFVAKGTGEEDITDSLD